MKPRASMDIGSNSLLLTVLDGEGRLLHDEARVVGLGKGLGEGGTFRPDRKALGEQVLREYVAKAAELGVPAPEIQAVATSGARRAIDAGEWFAALQRELGLHIRIVSGEEEARLTWKGAHVDLDIPDGPRLVVDLGGGSTELVLGELVLGEPEAIALRVSLELGSVRLTERFLCGGTDVVPDRYDLARFDALRRYVDETVAAVDLHPRPLTVVGVASSVTTLTAMMKGLVHYDRDAVHGARLPREVLARFSTQLLHADAAQRRQIAAISPERADYLLAGATVLDRVLAAVEHGNQEPQAMLVSDRGLRFGILYDH
jgi:exopolyphosphatase/guanosine-5'-triphosphate,3'-diphosphate pyrophosphatase